MESESILSITHELPTKGAEIRFDYSGIGDDIDVYCMPITGSTSTPRITYSNRPHLLVYKYAGWLMPKNGYVFAWWKKSK